jgi:hypothetical protein
MLTSAGVSEQREAGRGVRLERESVSLCLWCVLVCVCVYVRHTRGSQRQNDKHVWGGDKMPLQGSKAISTNIVGNDAQRRAGREHR